MGKRERIVPRFCSLVIICFDFSPQPSEVDSLSLGVSLFCGRTKEAVCSPTEQTFLL